MSGQTNFAEFVNIETIIFLQSNAELDPSLILCQLHFLLQSALIVQRIALCLRLQSTMAVRLLLSVNYWLSEK